MHRVKNQHLVAQSYLKRFCADGKKLYVFSKPDRKVFQTGIRNIACEQGFYDLPSGHSAGVQAVETALNKIETRTSVAIDNVLQQVNEFKCFEAHDPDRRASLAMFMVLQDCRTRQFRSSISDAFRRFTAQIAKKHTAARKLLGEREDQILFEEYEIPGDMTAEEHAEFMFRPEFLQLASEALLRHIWVVGENVTSQPFFTSDDPLIRHAHCPHPTFGGSGLCSRGIQIAIPLSPKHLLILFERSHFAHLARKEGSVLLINEPLVEFYNGYQIAGSYRQIFCSEDKFDQVRTYERVDPDVFELDRSSFVIG